MEETRKNITDIILDLEKRVAALEGQVQEQPKNKLNLITKGIDEISDRKISLQDYIIAIISEIEELKSDKKLSS